MGKIEFIAYVLLILFGAVGAVTSGVALHETTHYIENGSPEEICFFGILHDELTGNYVFNPAGHELPKYPELKPNIAQISTAVVFLIAMAVVLWGRYAK